MFILRGAAPGYSRVSLSPFSYLSRFILPHVYRRRIVAAGAEKRRGRSISSREHRVIGSMLGGLVVENLVSGSRYALTPLSVYGVRVSAASRDAARRRRMRERMDTCPTTRGMTEGGARELARKEG